MTRRTPFSRRRLLRGGIAAGLAGLVAWPAASCGKQSADRNVKPPPGIPTGPTVSVREYGLRKAEDDNSAVLQKAVDDLARRGGGVVKVPAGRWICNGLLLRSSVFVVGEPGQTTLAPDRPSTTWIKTNTSARNTGLADLILDCGGLVTRSAFSIGNGGQQITVKGCDIRATVAAVQPVGIDTGEHTRQVSIQSCIFDGLQTCIFLGHDPADVTIADSILRNWVQRGIWVRSTANEAARRLTIMRNSIFPPDGRGSVRQPIQINGVDHNLIDGMKITDNKVFGTGTDYRDPEHPGPADLISLQRCKNFEVSNNVCVDGGEVGITISLQCTDGIVEDNQCLRNGSSGICIGSAESQYVSNVTVKNNVCYDNGRRGVNDQTPGRARAGINVHHGRNIRIIGNTCANTGRNQSQLFGITMIASQGIKLSANNLANNDRARYYSATS